MLKESIRKKVVLISCRKLQWK